MSKKNMDKKSLYGYMKIGVVLLLIMPLIAYLISYFLWDRTICEYVIIVAALLSIIIVLILFVVALLTYTRGTPIQHVIRHHKLKKFEVLAMTAHLLDDRLNEIFNEKLAIDKLDEGQIRDIDLVNLKLEKLSEEHISILAKKLRHKINQPKYDYLMDKLSKKRESFIAEINDIVKSKKE